jgi:uncharacterized protein (TIGR03435 family)
LAEQILGGAEHADDPAGPTIVEALEKQLGLKLEKAKGPIEYLVIDRVERPPAN